MSHSTSRKQGEETRRQILDYIIDYKTWNDGNSPTVRQIAEGACDHPRPYSVVHYNLKKLAKSGVIEIVSDPGSTMSICVRGAVWTPPVGGR